MKPTKLYCTVCGVTTPSEEMSKYGCCDPSVPLLPITSVIPREQREATHQPTPSTVVTTIGFHQYHVRFQTSQRWAMTHMVGRTGRKGVSVVGMKDADRVLYVAGQIEAE